MLSDPIMNSVSASTGSGLPSSRTPNPPANTTLPPWIRPMATPGAPVVARALSTKSVICLIRSASSACGLRPANDSRASLAGRRLVTINRNWPPRRSNAARSALTSVMNQLSPKRRAVADICRCSAGAVSYSYIRPASQPPCAGCSRSPRILRAKLGSTEAHAALTASPTGILAGASMITTLMSFSGPSSTRRDPRASLDSVQPAGTVRVVPAALTRATSAVTVSGLASASAADATTGFATAAGGRPPSGAATTAAELARSGDPRSGDPQKPYANRPPPHAAKLRQSAEPSQIQNVGADRTNAATNQCNVRGLLDLRAVPSGEPSAPGSVSDRSKLRADRCSYARGSPRPGALPLRGSDVRLRSKH